MFNSSLFTPALLRTHSFVFFAVHVTRNILLSPCISKASRRVSSFFLRVQLSQPYVAIFAVKRSLRIPRETRETTLGSRTAKEQNRTEPAGLCVGLRQETDGLAESWVEGLVDVRSNLERISQYLSEVTSASPKPHPQLSVIPSLSADRRRLTNRTQS